ncbi:MAG: serine hydrolase [Candidatus Nealsonbacteria bacterium]|nr:serine hydrolase [Candidatus Nealsonbacteria bacterium]
MSKTSKFLIIFLISFAGWWGVNLLYQNLEEVYYFNEVSKNPKLFLAQINISPETKLINQVVEKYPEIKNLEIEATSAISFLMPESGEGKIIFQKNIYEKRPIASLTKLMTALVAKELYRPEQIMIVSEEAINQEEQTGDFKTGDELSLNELLHSVLIESSNDAAWAIAEGKMVGAENFVGEKGFVELMNLEAQNLEMENTNFVNPTGLDGQENYSTAQDLLKLVQYIIKKHPDILDITQKKSHEVLKPDGTIHHFIPENTNKLLGQNGLEIVGGKTGFTEEAGGCIILVLKEKEGDYLISLILGAKSQETRFEEMKKIIEAINK